MSSTQTQVVRLLDRINAGAAWLARWAVLLMLAIGIWNVIGRYLGSAIGINLSSNGLIEAQWYLFDLIFLLGLGWTLAVPTGSASPEAAAVPTAAQSAV